MSHTVGTLGTFLLILCAVIVQIKTHDNQSSYPHAFITEAEEAKKLGGWGIPKENFEK